MTLTLRKVLVVFCKESLCWLVGRYNISFTTQWEKVKFKNMFPGHVYFVWLFFSFFLFVSRVLITLYSLTLKTGLDDIVCVLFRPKKKKKQRKRKKTRNYNQIFNVKFKLLVSFFFFFEPNVWKLVIRREKQRCTGHLDNSLVYCSILFVSDCIPLYCRIDLNYFNLLKLYLILSNQHWDWPLRCVSSVSTLTSLHCEAWTFTTSFGYRHSSIKLF